MQIQPNMQNRWANFDEVRNCWKIDIKFETDGFSKLMLNLLIRSVAWTEQDYQPDRLAVEELRKALEESKLEKEDASRGDENKWIRLFPSAEITLSKRSKGQHLSYTEKLHIMNMHKHQGLQENEIWALYRVSHSTFRKIQIAFKFGTLPRFSEWRRIPSKLLHSKLVVEKVDRFVNQSQSSVTVKDVQLYLLKSIGVQIQSHIIVKILKKKLRYSWKRTSQRKVNLDFERNEQLKVLYNVRLAKWLSHLSLLVNVDGSSFSKDTHIGYSWAKTGEEKVVKGIIFKGSISVISSIATDGKAYTEVVEGTLTGAKFIAYLDRLLKYLNKIADVDKSKIGIIMDNCSVHRSIIVSNHFVNNEITQILLPPYWPELAPVELFFSLVKRRILRKYKNEELNLSRDSCRKKILEEFNKIDRDYIRNLWKPMFHKMKKSLGDLVTIL